jgi:hypothetical protein
MRNSGLCPIPDKLVHENEHLHGVVLSRSFDFAQDFAWRLRRRQDGSRCTTSYFVHVTKCAKMRQRDLRKVFDKRSK